MRTHTAAVLRRSLEVLVAATLVTSLSQCSSNSATSAPSEDAGTPTSDAGGSTPLAFSTCTLLTNPAEAPSGGVFDGIASANAECATLKLPAVWSSPGGDTIDVFVKRYPAATQPAKGQAWFLNGGPGGAGSDFEAKIYVFSKLRPDLDLYLPDHRGTGKSSFASCSPALVTSAQVAKCAARFPHLDGLTTTDAAKDLAALIDATRAPSQDVFVYGFSYGTYWAQRYLEIRPDQPTAMILDSTVPASGMDFAKFDVQFDATARAVLDLCKADATCAAKLGADPSEKAAEALAAVDAGTCNPGVGSTRQFLGQLLLVGRYNARLLLPPAYYRILRCNDDDRAWFAKVGSWIGAMNSAPVHGYSNVVFYNVTFNDFWPGNPTPAELTTAEQSMLAILGFAPQQAVLASSWPRAPHDTYYGTWPSASVPTLILQGTLDANTPFGDVVKSQYNGPNQYFVQVPNANHGVVDSSPMADPTALSCGAQIVVSYLSNPRAAPDTSCIAGMAPLDFGHPPSQWLAGVGITDLWENP